MKKKINGDVTWKTEFYFLASLLRTPRYIHSVEQPHALIANKELLSLFRMMEQAINRRGNDDPLMDRLDYQELELTAEFSRNTSMDVRSVWKDLSDPTIKAAPERFHQLLEHYAALRFLEEKFCDRMAQLEQGVYGPEETVNHIQSDVVSLHMSEQYESNTVRRMMHDMWHQRFNNPSALITTGFKKMDDIIGALVPGCTYLWTARTSHGKSSWVAQVVNHQAKAGHRVGIISLEDSKSVWASRWMSKVSGVPLGKIRDNVLTSPDSEQLTDKEAAAIEHSTETDYLDNVFLADAKGGRLTDVLRVMNDLCVRHGCQVIWIDYLQAIYADARNTRSRRDWLEYCWAMMEREADRLSVPLMLTAQLNREWEGQPLPTMPGLRHTEWIGAAEQKCYVGAVIYRPFRDPRHSDAEKMNRFNDLLINIEKCKQGENVAIKYKFEPSQCLITEL